MRGARDTFGQRRQYFLTRFHQAHLQVGGLNMLKTIAGDLFQRIVELCGQFDAGRARADDGNTDAVRRLCAALQGTFQARISLVAGGCWRNW